MNPRNLFYGALATAGVSGLVIALFRYGLPLTTLLLIVISMLVMAIVGLAVSAMRARRKKGGSVEDALRAQSEREAASMAPDQRSEPNGPFGVSSNSARGTMDAAPRLFR